MDGLPNVVFVPAGMLLLLRAVSEDWSLPSHLSLISLIELSLYMLTLLCLYLKVVKPSLKVAPVPSPTLDLVKAFCLLADIELKVSESQEARIELEGDYVPRLLSDLQSSYTAITATPKPTATVTLLL